MICKLKNNLETIESEISELIKEIEKTSNLDYLVENILKDEKTMDILLHMDLLSVYNGFKHYDMSLFHEWVYEHNCSIEKINMINRYLNNVLDGYRVRKALLYFNNISDKDIGKFLDKINDVEAMLFEETYRDEDMIDFKIGKKDVIDGDVFVTDDNGNILWKFTDVDTIYQEELYTQDKSKKYGSVILLTRNSESTESNCFIDGDMLCKMDLNLHSFKTDVSISYKQK